MTSGPSATASAQQSSSQPAAAEASVSARSSRRIRYRGSRFHFPNQSGDMPGDFRRFFDVFASPPPAAARFSSPDRRRPSTVPGFSVSMTTYMMRRSVSGQRPGCGIRPGTGPGRARAVAAWS